MMRHWPILFTLGIFAITTVILWNLCLAKNGGQFIYTLDDPYIHMAVAKNVAQHGVWGITPYQFSSSSSSPLWTLCLALCYVLFGVRDLIPFILNLIFAGLALVLVGISLRGRLPGWLVCLTLLGLVFFTPLVPLVFSGMEHTLHLFLTLLTVALAARALSEQAPSPALRRGLLVSAFLTSAVRYEGLFLILVLSILFACRKRWLDSLLFAGAGLLPLVIYGVWSTAHGWYFLPNPVILKGAEANRLVRYYLEEVLVRGHPLTLDSVERLAPAMFISRINAHPPILYLVIASLIVLVFRRGSFWNPVHVTNTAFMGSALLHMQFASTGWFYRYEAYVVAFGIYAVALGLSGHSPDRLKDGQVTPLNPRETGISPSPIWGQRAGGWGYRLLRLAALLLLAILVSLPLRVRAAKSLRDTPKASHNIFEQQYQMALFLRQFYQGQVVAANDIGLIDYMADLHLVDLTGLGTRESASFRLRQMYSSRYVAAVAEQYRTQIALVYDSWFQIPAEWTLIGKWEITDNVVCGDKTVSFYAVDPSAAPGLIENMQGFTPHLPGDVIQILENNLNRDGLRCFATQTFQIYAFSPFSP
jgi:hypothetical protein